MSQPAPEKKKRKSSKTRVWEKERRDRINDYFKKLWEVLPMYDASKPLSKPEILIHAAATIKELDEKLKSLLENTEGEKASEKKLKVSADVIKKLQDHIKKLLLRNEQLTNLLSTTGIKIPSDCGVVKKSKGIYKFSNAISADQQTKLLQKELEKENQVKIVKTKKSKPKTKNKNPYIKGKKRVPKKTLLASNCLFVLSQPSFQSNPCFILSKPTRGLSQTVLPNSLLVKTPLVSSQVKSSLIRGSSQLSNLGPGTLVFANGAIMPLIPPPTRSVSIYSNPTPAPLSTLIVVTTKNRTNPSTASIINSSPVLRPKSITRTTQVNKVPIPALTSKYNRHSCVESKKAASMKSTGNKVVGESRKKVADNSEHSHSEAKKFKSDSAEPNRLTEKTGVEKTVENDTVTNSSVNVEKKGASNEEVNVDLPRVPVSKSAEEGIEVSTASGKINEIPSSSQTNVQLSNPFELCPESTINPTNSSENFVLNELANHEVGTKGQQPTKDSNKDCMEDSSHKHNVLNNELQTDVINQQDLKSLEMHLPSTELSNDIFASFNVPSGCQNQESTSPTAAFLLAFPLVSSGTKVAEVMGEDNTESQAGTPNLLQIGTMDIVKPTQSYSDGLTPNLLNFDSFAFFGTKEHCSGFYNPCSSGSTTTGKNMNSFASGNFEPTKINKLSGDDKFTAVAQYNNKGEVNQTSSKQVQHSNSSDSKFTEYHMQLKDPNSNGSKMQGLIQSNTVDISSDIFSFKTPVNDNYTTKNCAGPSSSYSAKFPCNYTNYKTCTNSTSNSQQFMMDGTKHQYAPVCTSASVSNNFFNTFVTDDISGYSSTEAYAADFHNKKSVPCSSISQTYQKDKIHHNEHQQKTKPVTQTNKLINWMTTPTTTATTVPCKSDYFLPPAFPATNSTFTNTMTSNNYFNSSVYANTNDHFSHHTEPAFSKKASDIYTTDENQFTWSPSKIPPFLDPQNHSFVPSTLPTLVGDLALNTTPLVENKTYNKERVRDTGNNNRPSRKVVTCETQNHSSFFSVSQLVENQESGAAKISSRRHSGNRSKSSTSKGNKRSGARTDSNKDALSNYQKNDKSGFNISVASNLFNSDKQTRNNPKNIRSSYSAEALIGNHVSAETSMTQRNNQCQPNSTNKGLISNFLNDSMYFPSIEVSQENSYSTQNYHHSNPTSFPQHFNSGYSSNNFTATFTSSYVPSNTFMSTNTQDFLADTSNLFQSNTAPNKEKCNFSSKNCYKPPEKMPDKNQSFNCKKAKKRLINDNVLPSLDIHFLSMPGAINSPILPDDFHTTYLPPNTLYPCKNPLYSKPNSESIPNTLIPSLHSSLSGGRSAISQIQHPQMSPSVNPAGTTLTNFNLSTICPEIDKGLVQETYPQSRIKDYNTPSKSFANTSSHHIGSLPFV